MGIFALGAADFRLGKAHEQLTDDGGHDGIMKKRLRSQIKGKGVGSAAGSGKIMEFGYFLKDILGILNDNLPIGGRGDAFIAAVKKDDAQLFLQRI